MELRSTLHQTFKSHYQNGVSLLWIHFNYLLATLFYKQLPTCIFFNDINFLAHCFPPIFIFLLSFQSFEVVMQKLHIL